MKRVLGLDLGTTSIGWALVEEAEDKSEKSTIIKLGVRVNPLSSDEKTDFEKGRPLSTNAERTLKRGARRNQQRFKLRRAALNKELIENNFISKDTPLTELGKGTTHQTLFLRAKAASEKINLEDLAKVLRAINKKRGYKSSRKATNDEEGQAIDGMAIAKELYDRGITPGQYVLEQLNKEKKYIPDFYRSDLKEEFDKIWNNQKKYYDDIFSDDLYNELQDKSKSQTWAICKAPFNIVGIKLKGKSSEQKLEKYQLRASALNEKINLEHLAIVLQEINNELNNSSGYLGAISDRSKELYFDNLTVGQYLYNQISENPHISLKNQVFYRQDYLDEFEVIWTKQAEFHKELTIPLKEKIRDITIFYQRKLKSQKGLLDFCQFESWEQEYIDKTTQKTKKRKVGRRVISKSSPLFQEAKVWQNLNNLVFTNESSNEQIAVNELDNEILNEIFQILNIRGNQKPKDILNILKKYGILNKVSLWKTNYEEIEGNRTNQALFNAYYKIADSHGYGHDWNKRSVLDIKNELKVIFSDLNINPEILEFDGTLPGNELEKQASFQLWHLLYSAEEDVKINEEDKIKYGNNDVGLKKNLQAKFGFNPEDTKLIASISFPRDFGNLSSKALIKILPELQKGYDYYEACKNVGYNHSKSFNKEELEKRILKDKLEILKKNSLRNPVVEKILNQTVNVVNQIIDVYGKPDEVRIELARELKKSAKERSEMTSGIAKATSKNDDIKKLISNQFGIPNPTKNDVIRYKLYDELSSNGYKSLFSNKKINIEDIFSKKIDIEHILPKALIFDDSFSNKTLAYREINLEKDKSTAFDYITNYKNSEIDAYTERVESLFKANAISKAKRIKLLMSAEDLPSDFIERDLRNSQYIAKKAKEMLFEVFKIVVSTSGSITSKLREDWDLINIMKELNFPKYKALGLIETETRYNKGTEKYVEREVIQDWTKRNDHRHHAMDALTVAFTKHNHIQYINNLNARYNTNHKMHARILNIQNSITEMVPSKNGSKKRKFTPPMPNFRTEAKKHIESILISFKNKNKVVTQNINIYKVGKTEKRKIQLTPRGQLHEATIYGKIKRANAKPTKINARFDLDKARMIVNPAQRELVLKHLAEFNNDSKKAFSSKEIKTNSLIYKNKPLFDVICFEEIFTIRKEINPDNFKTQKIIDKIIDQKTKDKLSERLKQFNNDPKKAFSDLEKNPIWLNKEKGVKVKRATISGMSNVEALHHKKDHLGKTIIDESGKAMPTDFVSTGNNHHVAIYKDAAGKLQEKIVSFYEAVARSNEDLPIIDKSFNADIGWEFQFTLKQNEMFVFPDERFDIENIDLLDAKNSSLISPFLFRVQTISTKDYRFRHHLETMVTNNFDFTYKRRRTPNSIKEIKKVRLNHLGQIVQVGEY